MMNIAYLVNQYPKVSHSFIRREITGLEACGLNISRFSIRNLGSELVDAADQAELAKTRFVLGVGALGLFWALLRTAIAQPQRFWQTVRLVLQIGWRSERGLLRHGAYLAEACVLLGWFATDSIDHVHAHFGTNSTTVAMLCHALGGPPYSFTVHGPEEFDKAQAIALPEKIHRAAFVVAISSFGRSQLFRWCDHEDWAKVHVVRCGVDQLFLNQAPQAFPQTRQLVCVGRLSEQKGHLLLVEAASRLATAGFDFKLVFVGDGPLRPQIEALIAQLGLDQHIEITGWASNAAVQQHLLDAQVMVLPSFAEGLPVVIMEALALGRPVISTYVAGIPELVEPGVCGWLVPPGSVDRLTEAIRGALTTDPDALARMGQLGSERVAVLHDAFTEAQKLCGLFESGIKSAALAEPTAREHELIGS